MKKYLQTVEARGELASLLADNKFLDIKQNLDSVISELIVLLDEHQERSEKMANHLSIYIGIKNTIRWLFLIFNLWVILRMKKRFKIHR